MEKSEFLQKFLDSYIGSRDILNNFLISEINSVSYRYITDFIDSYEIRKGEYEGNEFIILKVDRNNFILYPEHDNSQGGTDISYSLAIYKDLLKEAINIYAEKNNIK